MSDTSTSTSICYVTMFLDIGRAEWKNVFTRTFEQYLKDFEPFIPLFNKNICNDNLLFVFIDKSNFLGFVYVFIIFSLISSQ